MCSFFYIGDYELSAYLVFTVLAAGMAVALAVPTLRRNGLSTARSLILLGAMCAAFLAAARLWNAAVSPWNYNGELKWYSLKLAGLSLYGGVIGAGLALLLLLSAWKKPIWPALDAMTVPGGAAFCVARIGCFLNGCCSGRATRCALGVEFPSRESSRQLLDETLPFLNSVRTVHPTQLYELAGAALGIPVVLFLCRRLRLREGSLFLLYGAWFSAVRLSVLPLRVLNYPEVVKEVVYPLMYATVAVVGILLAVRRGKSPADSSETPSAER